MSCLGFNSRQLLRTTVLYLERVDDFTCTLLKLVWESVGARRCGSIVAKNADKSALCFVLIGDTEKVQHFQKSQNCRWLNQPHIRLLKS